jgi:hypothetical protein
MLDPSGRLFRLWQQGQSTPHSGKPAAAPNVDDDGVPTPWNDLATRPVMERAALLSAVAGTGADPAALAPPAHGWKDPKRAIDSLAFATALLPGIGDVTGLLSDAYMYATEPESRTWENGALTTGGLAPGIAGAAIIRNVRNTPWGKAITGDTWQEVVEALRQQKSGAIVGHLDHPLVSPDIALPYGVAGPRSNNKGFGLAKLDAWHPEIVDRLPELLRSTSLTPLRPDFPTRAQLAGPRMRASVASHWDDTPIDWLVTAFDPTLRRK